MTEPQTPLGDEQPAPQHIAENVEATTKPASTGPEDTTQDMEPDADPAMGETVVLVGDELTPSVDVDNPAVTYLSITSYHDDVGPVQMDIALGVDSLVELCDMLTARIVEIVGDDADANDSTADSSGKRSRFQRITDPANIGHLEFDMNKPIIGPVTPVHILAGLILLAVFVGILGSI